MKYLHKFTSMADFQAAYDGQDYIEPWVSLTIDAVNDVNKVDYNKQPVVEEYDIEIDCNGEASCIGQEILSMSSRVGPYDEVEGYTYSITNPNLTTDPLETIKVKITNTPSDYDIEDIEGLVVECTHSSSEGNNMWQSENIADSELYVEVHADNNDGEWEFRAFLSEGC